RAPAPSKPCWKPIEAIAIRTNLRCATLRRFRQGPTPPMGQRHDSSDISMSSLPADFVVTHEHQRFAEFCEACRRYRYIGLCYGSPGVGKSLSAQHYANWFHLQAYASSTMPSAADFATVAGSTTVFYTPDVV